MDHECFPVPGFEFMNQPATDEQKDIFCDLADQLGKPVDRNGPWPEPFTKWDCAQAIDTMKEQVTVKQNAEPKWWALLTKEREDRNECMKMLSGILEDFEGHQDIPHFLVKDLIEAFKTQLNAYRGLTNLVRDAIVPEEPSVPAMCPTCGHLAVHVCNDYSNLHPCKCIEHNGERYHHPHCTAYHTTKAVGYVGGLSPQEPELFRGIWPDGIPVET